MYPPCNSHMLVFDIKPRAKKNSQDRHIIILNSVKNKGMITNAPYFFSNVHYHTSFGYPNGVLLVCPSPHNLEPFRLLITDHRKLKRTRFR
jgi:hypothetical protein